MEEDYELSDIVRLLEHAINYCDLEALKAHEADDTERALDCQVASVILVDLRNQVE